MFSVLAAALSPGLQGVESFNAGLLKLLRYSLKKCPKA
jgi:hypothetical protein